MHSVKKDAAILLTIGGILSFFIFGLFDSLKGSTLSALLKELDFDYSLGGTIVMGQYAGYLVASLLSGRLVDRFGHKTALIFAGICMITGVTGYAASSALPLLFVFAFFIGMGLGTLELSASHMITIYYPENKGRYLNILTAVAGIGSILSPVLVSALFHRGFSWRRVYDSGLVILLPVTVYFVLLKYPSTKGCTPAGASARQKYRKSTPLLFRKDFLLLYLANFLYMAAEMGISTWIVAFYMYDGMYTPADGAKFLSLFYLGMTSGRIVGSIFVDKLGRCSSVLFASAGAAACILSGALGPSMLRILPAVSGVFCSIIFPTDTAIISGFPKGDSGQIQGIYFACGGLGGMWGPWIMGKISDYLGVKWSMGFGGIFLAGVFFTLLFLKKNSSGKTIAPE